MKTLLRTSFVVLIGLGLASQALRASRGEAAIDPQGALIARLGQMRIETTAIPESRLLMARSPQCEQPFLVGPLRSDGAENETIGRLSSPDILVRYAYLGAVDAHLSAIRQFIRWARATLLFTVGLRAAGPPPDVIVVAFPRACGVLEATNWAWLSP
jgi:hypothetical protein